MAELPAAEIARLSGIKAVNACSLAQCGLEGTALYPVYPLMNSYCYCNTMYHIDPATKVMKVRAKTAIKAGEEITTRYVVPSMEQPARLQHIWRAWGFICSCVRCQSPSELGQCTVLHPDTLHVLLDIFFKKVYIFIQHIGNELRYSFITLTFFANILGNRAPYQDWVHMNMLIMRYM